MDWTFEDIQDAAQEVSAWWQKAHQNMLLADKYHRMDFKSELSGYAPDKARLLQSASGRMPIIRFARHIPSDSMQIEGIPKPGASGRPTAQSWEDANAKEAWLKAQFALDEKAAANDPTGYSPFAVTKVMAPLRGMIVLKTTENQDAWEPVKKESEDKKQFDARYARWEGQLAPAYPTTAVDPLKFFLSSDGEFAFHIEPMSLRSIRKEAKRWKFDLSKIPTQKENTNATPQYAWVEFWTDDECVYLLSHQHTGDIRLVSEIGRKKHSYGFIPFAWAYSGLGSGSTYTGGLDDGPQNLAVPLTFHSLDEVKEASLDMSAISNMKTTLGFPRLVYDRGTDLGTDIAADVVTEQGSRAPEYLMAPDKVAEFLQHQQSLEQSIERNTMPDPLLALGGQKPTATQTMAVTAEIQAVPTDPVSAIQRAYEMAARHKLMLYEKFGGDRGIRAVAYKKGDVETGYKAEVSVVGLNPGQIDHWYEVRVTIQTETPQQQALTTQTMAQQAELTWRSKMSAAMASGVENYEAEQQQRLVEMMLDGMATHAVELMGELMQLKVTGQLQAGDYPQIKQSLADKLRQVQSGQNAPPQMNGQTPTGMAAGGIEGATAMPSPM